MRRQFTTELYRAVNAQKFWARLNKMGPIPPERPELGPCWEWMGARQLEDSGEKSYGKLGVLGKTVIAHRLAWELAHNTSLPPGAHVLHACNNPPCCNPAHLFLGDQQANMRHRDEQGRTLRGEAVGTARLTADDVRVIRRAASEGTSHAKLAARYGVSPATVSLVVERKNWRHVP